jgi:outer membrane lipoprotein carrier protein
VEALQAIAWVLLWVAAPLEGASAPLEGASAPEAGAGSADALVRRIEQRHQRVTDLTARFTQTYRSGVLGRELEESGKLWIKRPGRMRWEYQDPDQKLFVSDGATFYFYVPEDRQVVVRDQAGDQRAPALLLAGESGILEQFEAGLESAPRGRHRLRLTPHQDDPEIQRLYLEVDRSYRILSIDVVDAQGNRSSFRFDKIRENVGLKDELFRFEIPPGVDVVAG